MDSEAVIEVLVAVLALVYVTARWIYRQLRGKFSRRRSPLPANNLASPRPAVATPTSLPHRRVAAPSALGSFFGVLCGSLVFATWVSSQVSVPPNVARAAAYFPVWFCIGAPLISAFSAVAVTIADNAFREFQAMSLPRGVPFVIGALIGFAVSLIFAAISLATPCRLLPPC